MKGIKSLLAVVGLCLFSDVSADSEINPPPLVITATDLRVIDAYRLKKEERQIQENKSEHEIMRESIRQDLASEQQKEAQKQGEYTEKQERIYAEEQQKKAQKGAEEKRAAQSVVLPGAQSPMNPMFQGLLPQGGAALPGMNQGASSGYPAMQGGATNPYNPYYLQVLESVKRQQDENKKRPVGSF